MATDQSKVNLDAIRSLGLQSGRPMADDGDPSLPELSLEAKNRKDILSNIFPNLPSDLPSWELLAAMSVPDAMSVIKEKIQQAKDDENISADVDSFKKATTPVSYTKIQVDDRLTNLHSASFLRAPLSEDNVWAHLVPTSRPDVVTFLPESAIGSGHVVSESALKTMHDRTKALEMKKVLKSNANIEKSSQVSVPKRRAVEGTNGEACQLKLVADYDYKNAVFPWEIFDSMLAAGAAYAQIWPLSTDFWNMLRCLSRFQLFHDSRISTKFQISICRQFIDGGEFSSYRILFFFLK